MDVSIYEHILAHVPDDGSGLTEGGARLPDEPEEPDGELRIGFAPGLLDHVVDPGPMIENEQAAARALRKLEAFVTEPSDDTYEELYDTIRANEDTGFFDPFVRRVHQSGLPRAEVREIALRLVTRSVDRMPVKVGICLLGLSAKQEDRWILITLGRHEEFSHYVGVALTNALPDPEGSLWELAKVVDGWGRVAFVEQLAGTTDPEIKAWIVREGFTTSYHWTDLAPIAATTGELARELRAEEIDDELYRSAGRILVSLIGSRVFEHREDIDDYEDAPEAISLFLNHVDQRDEQLETFEPVAVIVDYLEQRDSSYDWFDRWTDEKRTHSMDRVRSRWSDKDRKRVLTQGRWTLQRPAWRQLIDDGLRSPEHSTFALAERAARWLGDDTVPLMLDRLRRHLDDDQSWFEASRLADEEQFDELLETARERVELNLSSKEPFPQHWLIGIRQELERFPGKGWPLFRAALESPTLGQRRFGIGFLRDVPAGNWPEDADRVLETVARTDPDHEMRSWATDLWEQASFRRVTTP